MPYSSWMIRPPSEQMNQTAAAHRRATSTGGGDASRFAAFINAGADAAPQPTGPAQAQPAILPAGGSPVLAGRSPSDLMRFQTLTRAQADMRQTQALDGMMQSLAGNGSTLDLARSMGQARHLRRMTSAFDNRLTAPGMGDVPPAGAHAARRQKATQEKHSEAMDCLSARFESGQEGIAAIGYDRNGGTSYGKYQIASRVGSMKKFLSFLDEQAPDLAKRLREAGPANTGSRRGAMPNEWRAIAREQPQRFEELQEDFIRESHYKPAVAAIAERTGLEVDTLSPVMREVIWSTAVQHGPAGAARLFDRADSLSGKPSEPGYERKLISNVYKLRAGQFGSSSAQVQAAVQSRFREERLMALNMLDAGKNTALA